MVGSVSYEGKEIECMRGGGSKSKPPPELPAFLTED